MSNTPTTPNPMDVGMATGPQPTPAMPSAIQPNDAQPEQRRPQSGAQPNQPAANSNTPMQILPPLRACRCAGNDRRYSLKKLPYG